MALEGPSVRASSEGARWLALGLAVVAWCAWRCEFTPEWMLTLYVRRYSAETLLPGVASLADVGRSLEMVLSGLLLGYVLPTYLFLWPVRRFVGLPRLGAKTGLTIGLTFLALLAVRLAFFGGPRFASDEVGYHFLATLLAHGRLWAPLLPDADSFASAGSFLSDRWSAAYQPGWPAVLALFPGAIANALMWLGSALLIRRLSPRAVLWFVASTLMAAQVMGDFAHLATLFWSLLCLVGGLEGRLAVAWLGILGVLLTRAQDAVLPWTVATLWLGIALPRRQLLWQGGVAVATALTLGVNHLQTGHFWPLPHDYTDQGGGFGFVFGHTPLKAVYNTAFQGARLAWWSPPFLLERAVVASPRKRALAAGALAILAIYALTYSNASQDWGARYYVSLGGALALMAAGGEQWGALLLACGLCTALPALTFIHDQSGPARELRRQLEAQLPGSRTLVLIESVPPGVEPVMLSRNRPDLKGLLTLLYLDPETNARQLARFPERTALVLRKTELVPYQAPSTAAEIAEADYRAGVNYLTVLQKPAPARACFERSLALRPGDPHVEGLLGYACRDTGDPDRALALWADCLRQLPGQKPVRIDYAALLRQRGREAEARAQLQQAIP